MSSTERDNYGSMDLSQRGYPNRPYLEGWDRLDNRSEHNNEIQDGEIHTRLGSERS